MHQYKHSDKRGFTLIELSIVLVIISLIVGGVIGGKSLINSARIQNAISDVEGLKVAINNFKLQYDAYPGDLIDAWDYFGSTCDANAERCNGNGDFKLTDTYEQNNGLRHLYLADLIPFAATGNSTSGGYTALGENVMPAPFDGGAYTLGTAEAEADDGLNWYNSSVIGNIIIMGSIADQRVVGPALTPRQAESIDKKMDDGNGHTGKVAGYWALGITTHHCKWQSWHANPYTWRKDLNDKNCYMYFLTDR